MDMGRVVQAVATPGTAEALTTSEIYAVGVTFMAKRVAADNVGNVFVGTSVLDGGVAEEIKQAAAALAELAEEENLEAGLNRRTMDPLHAYEEGVNVQPYVALLDYGNPVRWERLLATARRYDGHLLTNPDNGVRRLRGRMFSDSEVRSDERASRINPTHDEKISTEISASSGTAITTLLAGS